jgi:hypothetical protein
LNARKGECRTHEDLLDGLADVMVTAAAAMSAITDGSAEHLMRSLEVVTDRVGA